MRGLMMQVKQILDSIGLDMVIYPCEYNERLREYKIKMFNTQSNQSHNIYLFEDWLQEDPEALARMIALDFLYMEIESIRGHKNV